MFELQSIRKGGRRNIPKGRENVDLSVTSGRRSHLGDDGEVTWVMMARVAAFSIPPFVFGGDPTLAN